MSGRGRLFGGRAVLVRGSLGFGVVFALQLADVMTFAREPEDQRAESECEPGFAKKWSHKVRHTKRRASKRARGKAGELRKRQTLNVQRPMSNAEEENERPRGHSGLDVGRSVFSFSFLGNELKGHSGGLL